MILCGLDCFVCRFLVALSLTRGVVTALATAIIMPDKNPTPAPFRLGYVTDVEGNLDYFLNWVAQSNVVDVAAGTKVDSPVISLSLRNNDCHFVYGGDVVDKGVADIRLTTALVDLKRRHPDKVTLLVGNRDLNKLRLTAELSTADLNRPLDEIPPPHWDPSAPTLRQFLQSIQDKMANDDTTSIPSLDDLNTRVNRLHYLLQHTLGCPRTFEFRRQELALLQQSSLQDIDDDAVVDNFLYEVEHGSLADYLASADVAVCIGNTLFCHGAVDAATMQLVPSRDTKFENPPSKPPAAAMVQGVHEWTVALNDYLHQGLADYRQRPYWNAARTSRGGEALMALQNRPAMWGRSIVSNCYGDGGCITTPHATRIRNDPERLDLERTNPLAFEKVSSDPRDPRVAEWLHRQGIQRVVVGHKPTGDCPAVLSATYTGVEMVSADTSFSDTSAADNRGTAVAGVEIVGTSAFDNQLVLSGSLRHGAAYTDNAHVRLHPGGVDTTAGDANLGTQFVVNNDSNDDDGEAWWIKAAVGNDYYLTRGSGRRVEYKRIPKTLVTLTSSITTLPAYATTTNANQSGDVEIQVQA